MIGDITYNKAGWVKYSNKLFPTYYKQHWMVEVEGEVITSIAFFNYELAVIFSELIKLRKKEKK